VVETDKVHEFQFQIYVKGERGSETLFKGYPERTLEIPV
jgi:hypothetical protein